MSELSPGKLKAGKLYRVNTTLNDWTLLKWQPVYSTGFHLVATMPQTEIHLLTVGLGAQPVEDNLCLVYIGLNNDSDHMEKWYYSFITPKMLRVHFNAQSLKHLSELK